MKNINLYNDEEILKLLGKRLRDLRLAQDMTQQALAKASGLSVFTITQTENGHNVSMLNIIKGLRGMGRLDLLSTLVTDNPELHIERKHASFQHHTGVAES